MEPGSLLALVFDFDGTIIDTETPEFESWQHVYSTYGTALARRDWDAAIGRAKGTGFDPYSHLDAVLGKHIDADEIRKLRRPYNRQLVELENVRPGITTWLNDAKRLGIKAGIASSSGNEWVEGHLERLGLIASFDCISCFDGTVAAKPSPDLYVQALTRMAVPPEQAIAIEDSPNGVTAAKAAGIYCIAVPGPFTASLPFPHADLIVSELSEIRLEDFLTVPKAMT